MIYVISKATFGSYNVRDIQCNANWCGCPYSDYALIPDNLVDGILATCGYCDIKLNDDGTEVVSFVARPIPQTPEVAQIIYCKVDFERIVGAELDNMPVGGVKTIFVRDPNSVLGAGTSYHVTMHKNDHNLFPSMYEHFYMAEIEIHGNGEFQAYGLKFYNGDEADVKWGVGDPKLFLTEANTADRITDKGKSEDGWTWERWESGKFEAWRYFNVSTGGADDLGAGNYFRYKYTYDFDLPFESMITPHVFVSLRSDGEDLLCGVTPGQGSKWWSTDSLNQAMVTVQMEEMGRPMGDCILIEEIRNSMVEKCNISESDFYAALNACNGDAGDFIIRLIDCAHTPDSYEATEVSNVLLSYGFNEELLQQVFDNTEPTPGSVTQVFTVLSTLQESAHKVNADIHVIGTWKSDKQSDDTSHKETRYATIEDALAGVNATENGGVLAYRCNDGFHVVLLDDIESATTINITKDCTLHLNGKTLSFTAAGAYLNITAADKVTIDGEIAGSTIKKDKIPGQSGVNEYMVKVQGTNLSVHKGNYILSDVTTASKAIVFDFDATSSVSMYGCTINANNPVYTAGINGINILSLENCIIDIATNNVAFGVLQNAGAKKTDVINSEFNIVSTGTKNIAAIIILGSGPLTVNSCKVYSCALTGGCKAYGIFTMADNNEVTDSHIEVDGRADYNGTVFGASAIKTHEGDNLVINGGYYYGTREALALDGPTRINGGVYEGCQHGGAYMSGSDIKAKNAIFRNVEYTGDCGWDNPHYGALYNADAADVSFDNCRFEAEKYASHGITVKENAVNYLSNVSFFGSFGNHLRADAGSTIYVGKNVAYDTIGVPTDPNNTTAYHGTVDTTTYADQEFGF